MHTSSNKHEGLAIRYLIASIAAIIMCAILSHFYGVEGAALSTMTADILLIPYVLKRSLEITNDNFGAFIFGIGNEIRMGSSTIKQLVGRRKKTAG